MATSNKNLHLTDNDWNHSTRYCAKVKIILLKSLSLIHLAKTNLQFARKSKNITLSLTNPSILLSTLMSENVQTNIHTTVLGTVVPSSHLSIKTCTLSWRMQRLWKIQSLPVRQVQVWSGCCTERICWTALWCTCMRQRYAQWNKRSRPSYQASAWTGTVSLGYLSEPSKNQSIRKNTVYI